MSLIVKPLTAELQTGTDLVFFKRDPYVVCQVGYETHQTMACKDGGKHPTWNQTFIFKDLGPQLRVTLRDAEFINKNKPLGEGTFDLIPAYQHPGIPDNRFIDIMNNGKSVGRVECQIEYQGPAMQGNSFAGNTGTNYNTANTGSYGGNTGGNYGSSNYSNINTSNISGGSNDPNSANYNQMSSVIAGGFSNLGGNTGTQQQAGQYSNTNTNTSGQYGNTSNIGSGGQYGNTSNTGSSTYNQGNNSGSNSNTIPVPVPIPIPVPVPSTNTNTNTNTGTYNNNNKSVFDQGQTVTYGGSGSTYSSTTNYNAPQQTNVDLSQLGTRTQGTSSVYTTGGTSVYPTSTIRVGGTTVLPATTTTTYVTSPATTTYLTSPSTTSYVTTTPTATVLTPTTTILTPTSTLHGTTTTTYYSSSTTVRKQI